MNVIRFISYFFLAVWFALSIEDYLIRKRCQKGTGLIKKKKDENDEAYKPFKRRLLYNDYSKKWNEKSDEVVC